MGVNGEVFDEETTEPIDGVVVRVIISSKL